VAEIHLRICSLEIYSVIMADLTREEGQLMKIWELISLVVHLVGEARQEFLEVQVELLSSNQQWEADLDSSSAMLRQVAMKMSDQRGPKLKGNNKEIELIIREELNAILLRN